MQEEARKKLLGDGAATGKKRTTLRSFPFLSYYSLHLALPIIQLQRYIRKAEALVGLHQFKEGREEGRKGGREVYKTSPQALP